MSAQDNIERLFLLEILVDNVYISSSDLDLDPKTLSSLKQTCVKFQFLNYPSLEICEEDFAPGKGNYEADEVLFKSGKSCLFALKGQHPPAFSPPFNVYVNVNRTIGNNKSCTIGKTCIKLGDCFATIVNCCIVCPTSPTTKTIKDTYPLVDERNCKIGTITVFIRLSCFGKLIITQFQLGGLENKSFLFRADSENIKTKPAEKQEPKEIIPTQYKGGDNVISRTETFCQGPQNESVKCPPTPSPCCATRGLPMMQGPSVPCRPPFMGGMGGMMPPMGMGGMMPPMGMGGMMPPMGIMPGGGPAMQLMPLPNYGSGSKQDGPEPQQQAPSSDYKELTASVNGHELSIKILRKPKKPKEPRISQESSSSNEPEISSAKRKSYGVKEPCPFASVPPNGGYRMPIPKGPSLPPIAGSKPNVNNKENYIVRLGDCPPVCYKVPPKTSGPEKPCTTERDAQFEQEEMDRAMKLFTGGKGDKGGKKGGKGGKKGSKKGGKKGKKK